MAGSRRHRGGPGRRPGERAGGASAERERPRGVPAGGEDPRRLLHELEVHRVELELQTEELRAARLESELGLRRYAELFEVAPVGYLVIGGDGVVREVNAAAMRLLGRARDDLVGQRLSALVARDDTDVFGRFLSGVALEPAGPGDHGCEVTLASARSGAGPHVRLRGTPLAGEGDAVLVTVDDVSAQHAAREVLRDELRRKDEFLATLSHELRNPLAPIRNGLGLLARARPGGEQASRALRVVERQVAHLARIVDDLLDVTRIARGLIRLHREPAELGELVRRTVEDHRPMFDHAGVALETRLPREPCWALVDATRVAQVLGNLLGNAAKFTAPGGRVEVAVRPERDAAAVVVRDTGVGIAPELQRRLFEPFAQAPQPLERTRGGLGLGLATVKGLVGLHGGTVGLSSAGPGQGTEVTVRLPLTAPPAAARGEPGPGRAARRRVLVVDDNEDAATTLKELLELSGHEVQVALDGPRGVALARAFRPDVVICDIGLPGLDGYAVARALRGDAATRDAFLVALTGYALPDDVRRAAEAGFDRHLSKPLALDALERALAGPAPDAAAPPAEAVHSPDAGA